MQLLDQLLIWLHIEQSSISCMNMYFIGLFNELKFTILLESKFYWKFSIFITLNPYNLSVFIKQNTEYIFQVLSRYLIFLDFKVQFS